MISKRADDVTSFMVMDVMAKAAEMERAGEDIVHLEVGEPDFDTPKVIQDAAIDAIRSGKTHYTHAMGMLELREEICSHYKINYNIEIVPEQILVTSGTSPALLMIMMAILEQGDEIILSNPHYACYPNFIESVGGVTRYIQTYPEDGFQYRPQNIIADMNERTQGIIINSPSNPTGIVMDDDAMKNIAAIKEPYIISDEIYHGLVYEGRAPSILEYTDRAFVINGFSKLYAMTGWRLGYLIFPRDFSDVMERLHQNFMISANSFVQVACIAALRDAQDEVEEMKKIYNKRRLYMIERVKAMGLKLHTEPTGAFYVFADARHLTDDTYKMAFDILEKAKVGVTPGIDFGSGGQGFLRFSYATALDKIEEGMDRVEKYLNEYS